MCVVYVVLVLYMRAGWIRLPIIKPSQAAIQHKVSVIIAARNEEQNIGRTLDCLMAQDFPKELLEIIVVDDHSTDRTSEIINTYADRGVRLISLEAGDKLNSYKKYAINKAIDLSTGAIIVTTDADCRMGPQWLRTIIHFMEANDLYMVSSPVSYHEEKSYFENLQTLEFLYLIGLGAAGIGNGNPTTCNGANLAYRKSVFYEMGGFKGIDELASGDDELLLHKVAERYANRIGFCKAKASIVYTDAKENLSSFLSQRRRWASKSTKYKDKRVVALGVSIWLFNLALLVNILCFCWADVDAERLIFLSILLKIAVEFAFLYPVLSFAGRKSLIWNLPLLSILHSVYLVYIGVLGNVGKYDWKGRSVN